MTLVKNAMLQRWNRIDESWRFAIAAFLIARLFYFLWAWVIFTIQPVAIQNFELSGEPILSIFKLRNSEAHVYLREVKGETLTFQSLDREHLLDQQTGSVWDMSTGTAIQGELKGIALSPARTTPADLFPYHGTRKYPGARLALWQRFDANWYISIAENGYGSIPGDVHFPPLYPLTIRFLQPIFGSVFLAGLFLSHLATFYALKLLYDVFLQWGERTIARRSVLFFVIYPTFFFCFSAYSEPVFLVASLLALREMKSQSWLWAGFWIFCAILIRLQGVALLAPMAFLLWRDQPFLRKAAHWGGSIVAGSSGLLYLYLRSLQSSGNTIPLAEAELHARLVPPWQAYGYAIQTIFSGSATFIDILNWVVVTLVIVLLVAGWRTIPLEYNLFTVFSLLASVVRMVETQPLNSMLRYSLTFFPIFFVLGVAGENPWLRRLIIYTSILLSLYLSGQFFIWGWVA